MEIQSILTLIQAFTENSLNELNVEDNGVKIFLKKDSYGSMVQGGAALGAVTMTPGAGVPAVVPSVQAGAVPVPAPVNTVPVNVVPVNAAPISAAVVPAAVPVAVNAAAQTVTAEQVNTGSEVMESDKVVVSPLVGVFYSASSPDAEDFVKVGDIVKKGQVFGIIEAMKLMNEIESEYDGVVEAILVKNEDVVEYNQPLFRIR